MSTDNEGAAVPSEGPGMKDDLRPMPWLGPPRGEWAVYVCGHSAAPGEPHCNRDATWHGFALDDRAQRIIAMMESCEQHLPYMKLSADYVHPLVHPCNIPGSRFRWPENECYIEWDESAEFAALAGLEVAR